MNILHLRSSDIFGSPERLIIGQCRQLSQFHFLCGSFAKNNAVPKFLDECAREGFETVALNESFTGDLRVISQLREAINSRKIDLVVSHDYKSTFYTYWAARSLPVKRIAYYHGVTSEDFKVKIYNAIDTFTLRRTPHIVAVSEHTKKLLMQRGIEPHAISVVPNAIDATKLTAPEPNRSTDGPVKLIGAGRFSFEKGFDILIEAIAEIKDSVPPFVLYLYGRGPEEERLRQMVTRYNLGSVVQFMGFIDDIKPIFRTMDALVISSRSEGMPLIILEAWSEYLGIVATQVGGIPEMITPGETGLLVPPLDVSALKQSLTEAITDRYRMWQFGSAGHRQLPAKYSYARQGELLADIYVSFGRK